MALSLPGLSVELRSNVTPPLRFAGVELGGDAPPSLLMRIVRPVVSIQSAGSEVVRYAPAGEPDPRLGAVVGAGGGLLLLAVLGFAVYGVVAVLHR